MRKVREYERMRNGGRLVSLFLRLCPLPSNRRTRETIASPCRPPSGNTLYHWLARCLYNETPRGEHRVRPISKELRSSVVFIHGTTASSFFLSPLYVRSYSVPIPKSIPGDL
uniref:Uncharacterized protein n=1 Tax=Rhipicephalus zambeziensis TaxID=60191 RepID=A0A224YFV0_9ACAR